MAGMLRLSTYQHGDKIRQKYPLPSLAGFNDDLAGCTIFSKIDLPLAYQQVKIDEHSQHKTAIITTL